MTITLQAEPFSAALPDIGPLIDAHWEEVGSFKDRFRRQIDIPAYVELERQSRLLTVTARSDGVLFGYFVGVTGRDLHRVTLTDPPRRVPVCSWLVYYIMPEKRGYAPLLARAAERAAATSLGTPLIINTRVKPGMNGADAFFAKLGYKDSEKTMTRIIGDAADAGSRSQEGA